MNGVLRAKTSIANPIADHTFHEHYHTLEDRNEDSSFENLDDQMDDTDEGVISKQNKLEPTKIKE